MQGGTSPLSGSVELMLHRRLLDDDAFGQYFDDDYKSKHFYDGHDAHEAFGKYFHLVNSTSVPIHLPPPPTMTIGNLLENIDDDDVSKLLQGLVSH